MRFLAAIVVMMTCLSVLAHEPMSHGCVNLRVPEAEALFAWADLGTEVVVHE